MNGRTVLPQRDQLTVCTASRRAVEGETPDSGWGQVTPDPSQAFGLYAQAGMRDGASSGVSELNQLSIGGERLHHGAYKLFPIGFGKIPQRNAGDDGSNLPQAFRVQKMQNTESVGAPDLYLRKLPAQKTCQGGIPLDDKQTLRADSLVQNLARDHASAGSDFEHRTFVPIDRGSH